MFFANSRISFLKLVGSIMNIMERIYTKKKKKKKYTINLVQCSKC